MTASICCCNSALRCSALSRAALAELISCCNIRLALRSDVTESRISSNLRITRSHLKKPAIDRDWASKQTPVLTIDQIPFWLPARLLRVQLHQPIAVSMSTTLYPCPLSPLLFPFFPLPQSLLQLRARSLIILTNHSTQLKLQPPLLPRVVLATTTISTILTINAMPP